LNGELIKARTAEGRQRAKARGVRFGRKLKLTRHQILEALARREAGEALADIGRSYNVSHSTISRLEKDIRHELLKNVCAPTATIQIIREPDHCVSERSQFTGVMSAPTSGDVGGRRG
jgi:hypothetical protein